MTGLPSGQYEEPFGFPSACGNISLQRPALAVRSLADLPARSKINSSACSAPENSLYREKQLLRKSS